MTLIIDCGSTKAEWVVLDGENIAKRFITNGFNPNFTENETIKNIIVEAKNIIDNQDVSKIVFYGTGCASEANQNKVAMLFAMTFKINDIEVYPDSLGACHALFGRNAGVACILGTGSNACVYDGEKITESIVSLGFMLGDEGSGCHIGKRIVHDCFYKIMPEDLRAKFDEKYHLDRETLLKNVYHGDAPSRYLAEFARFAQENIENQYVKNIVTECFESFVQSSFRLERSGMEKSQSVGFVGSVSYAFQDILLQVLENHNIKCSKIMKNPMDGLIEYHKNL
ncbi:MAG: ATPase [Bacteroidales bacterium]|nr:ATPase [Bacteroidales bacterium]